MIGSALSLVAALQAAAPDTLYMAPVRDAFDWLQAGVLGVVLLATVLTVFILFRIVSLLGQIKQSVRPLVEQARQGIDPVLDHARNVSENVDFVSRAVREDVEGLAAAVDRIRKRLDQASDRMEERIEEFNALMEVVQGEAEDIFIDTAATVRGVREGTRVLTEGRAGDGGRRATPADGETTGSPGRAMSGGTDSPGSEAGRAGRDGPGVRAGRDTSPPGAGDPGFVPGGSSAEEDREGTIGE